MTKTRAEIDLLRSGFVTGRGDECVREQKESNFVVRCRCHKLAANKYPYPKVTRLREAHTLTNNYRMEDGCVSRRVFGEGWVGAGLYYADIAALASLLDADTLRKIADGPCGCTEEVEVE